jgi:hypothetical protein
VQLRVMSAQAKAEVCLRDVLPLPMTAGSQTGSTSIFGIPNFGCARFHASPSTVVPPG